MLAAASPAPTTDPTYGMNFANCRSAAVASNPMPADVAPGDAAPTPPVCTPPPRCPSVVFLDEMRLGLHGQVRRVWAPVGEKVEPVIQIVYRWR